MTAMLRAPADHPAAEPPRAVGLLAGSGRFPILFAEAAKRQGLPVACVGIRGEAPDDPGRPLRLVRRRCR